MKCKKVLLIINPGAGEHLARLTGMMAVFAAAGWKTETAVREYGGHARDLAREAARSGYDLVVGFGGDGTLNQVVNGVMADKRHRSIIGVIPGGTANVWSQEIGMPADPVKAALVLVNSKGRRIDLGQVALEGPPREPGAKGPAKAKRRKAGAGQQFLLMAGLGLDAAILDHVSSLLKEKLGEGAVALAAVESVLSQRAFPIEIRSKAAGSDDGVLWKGEALQVIVGNTRRYGNVAEATPEALIDDGVLDVCVITAGLPLTSFAQILATMIHRKPRQGQSEYFQGAHFRITVPARVGLQLDGSLVELKRHPTADGKASPVAADEPGAAMVTYRFDALPEALRAAIPCAYDNALFAGEAGVAGAPVGDATAAEPVVPAAAAAAPGRARGGDAGQLAALLEHGWKVTVVGVGPDPERKGTYIVAGSTDGPRSDGSKPVAVRIDRDTALLGIGGDVLAAGFAGGLAEGGVIVVEGAKSKREVIRATRVVVMN